MLQVVVVGSGITGLSVVHHLRARGLKRLALFSTQPSNTQQTPGIALGGFPDLLTRVSHARGLEIAISLWRFGNLAHEELFKTIEAAKIPFKRGSHIRLGLNPPEAKELSAAHQQLVTGGFDCYKGQNSSAWFEALNTLEVLWETKSSTAFDLPALLKFLVGDCFVQAKQILNASTENERTTLQLTNGDQIETEFVVLANHLKIGEICPTTQPWLVSYGDQWSLIDALGIPAEAVGSTISWNYGYNRLTFLNERQVALTGGRTFRKGAAIGVDHVDFRLDISQKLRTEFGEIFPEVKLGAHQTNLAMLECRPCDELPIIGPIPGDERILIGTGYMGQGLSLGFLAGKCLADIICDGRAPELPDILMPRRLRSLSES